MMQFLMMSGVFAILLYYENRLGPYGSLLDLAVWMVFGGWIQENVLPAGYSTFFVFYVITGGIAWIRDWKTRYFGPLWLVVLSVFVLFMVLSPGNVFPPVSSMIAALLFPFIGVVFYRRHSLGLADLLFLLVVAPLLGFERMSLLVGLSCLEGLFCLSFSGGDVPLVSLLVLNLSVVLFRGYTLYERLMVLLSGS